MRIRADRADYAILLLATLAVAWAEFAVAAMPNPATDREGFTAWQESSRATLRRVLGIPEERAPLDPEFRGLFLHNGLVIEKWVFTSEPGSRVPAVLYRPEQPAEKRMPCVVMTYGHGGSKSQPDYQYPAQCFARLGIACLAIDPLGEEERHREGRMGTRAHDPEDVHERAQAAERLIMGKFVLDTTRALDFVLTREDIDPKRIGVAGNSLGGAQAGWMAVLEPRLRFSVISGWGCSPKLESYGKFCTRVPNILMRESGLSWSEYLALAAPHCAVRIVNGDADVIIDKDGDGELWRETDRAVEEAEHVYAALGRPGGIQTWYEPGGGHRPYQARRINLEWLVEQVRPAGWTSEKVRGLDEINFGEWTQQYGIKLEKLYGTPLHLLGATVTDLDVVPLRREQLAVLRPEEIGRPEYTIEGWFERIEEKDSPALPGRSGEASVNRDDREDRKIKVAGIMNTPVREGDYKEANFRQTEALIRQAARAGAELVCTYEQFLDGYGFDANKIRDITDERVARYEVLGASPYVKRLADLAGELDIVLVAGLGVREESGSYNSALIFDRTGVLIGKYRKTHNKGEYARWFAPLSPEQKRAHCPSFGIGPGRIALKICNDRHFRETTAYMVEDGAELVLAPSFGSYDPSRLVDDSREYGLWAVFVHPEGCQFIQDGEVVSEQLAVDGKGSLALFEVAFRKPKLSSQAEQ